MKPGWIQIRLPWMACRDRSKQGAVGRSSPIHTFPQRIQYTRKAKAFADRSREEVYQLVIDRVIRPDIVGVWNLWPPSPRQMKFVQPWRRNTDAELDFTSWLNRDFVTRPNE